MPQGPIRVLLMYEQVPMRHTGFMCFRNNEVAEWRVIIFAQTFNPFLDFNEAFVGERQKLILIRQRFKIYRPLTVFHTHT